MNKFSSKTRQQQTSAQKDAKADAQAVATRAAKVKRALAVRAIKAWPAEKFNRADAYVD